MFDEKLLKGAESALSLLRRLTGTHPEQRDHENAEAGEQGAASAETESLEQGGAEEGKNGGEGGAEEVIACM